MDFETAKKIIGWSGKFKVRYSDYTETARLFVSATDRVCKYGKYRKRYGYPIMLGNVVSIEPITSTKTEEQVWFDGWSRVLSRLEKSGLWTEIQVDIKIALAVGLEKIKKANDEYWKNCTDELDTYTRISLVDDRLITLSDNGNPRANTSIIWYMSRPPKVKKMRFVRWTERNEQLLSEIAECLKAKTKCYQSGRYNYDVSFEYNPDTNKAFYSEEYKNCGNGHYYLALDSTHALFYEDD